MIPSHDLRTGNYVLAGETLQQITMINQQSSLAAMNPTGTNKLSIEHTLESIRPVAMTDDILKQCGFVYHDYFKFWQLVSGQEENQSEMDVDRDYNIIDFMRKPIIKNLVSLHQLQNIYYLLKGKELNFNESRLNDACLLHLK